MIFNLLTKYLHLLSFFFIFFIADSEKVFNFATGLPVIQNTGLPEKKIKN